jgi:hypothetical protein
VLMALQAGGHPALPELVDRVRAVDLEGRTTATSAALVRAACEGWCIDELAEYLHTLDRSPDPYATAASRSRLLGIGSSSGRGLLEGIALVFADFGRAGEAA